MTKAPSEKTIAIIGSGFCGMMTCIHLVKTAYSGCRIYLVNSGYPFGKGIAYSTDSSSHLLNVPAAKMSAFPSDPDHFLDWLHQRKPFSGIDKEMLGQMFVPRIEYGNYLSAVWEEMKTHKGMEQVELISDEAIDIEETGNGLRVHLRNGEPLEAGYAVLATGTETPANPVIADPSFFNSPLYFKNSWSSTVAKELPEGNVMIIGNGLTMVDTTLELLNNGCHGTIYSISPHGFTILPHRYNGMKYSGLLDELKKPYEINELYRLFCKHIKFVRQFGLSAEVVVDSVRSHSQEIWMSLDLVEKKRFMAHLRHLWGLARHRLPLHIYDLIQEMKRKKKLVVIKGRLLDITESNGTATVRFWNIATHQEEKLEAGRVINCTGPLTDITRSEQTLLQNLVSRGAIRPDPLKLGIDTDLQGAVISREGKRSERVYTLGSNLRGLLWESTAVPELRVQAEKLARLLAGMPVAVK